MLTPARKPGGGVKSRPVREEEEERFVKDMGWEKEMPPPPPNPKAC